MVALATQRKPEPRSISLNLQETETVSRLIAFAREGNPSDPKIALATTYMAKALFNEVVATVAQSGLDHMRVKTYDAGRHDNELRRELQTETPEVVACLQGLLLKLRT